MKTKKGPEFVVMAVPATIAICAWLIQTFAASNVIDRYIYQVNVLYLSGAVFLLCFFTFGATVYWASRRGYFRHPIH